MASNLLSLHNVNKRIAGRNILDNLSLEIESGQVIAVVGHNGSGKSTLMKVLSGLGGFDKGKRTIGQFGRILSIGYAPERFPKLNFNAVEYLYSMGRMQNIPKDELKARIEGWLTQFGLDPTDRRTMRNYSKGMLQKINLIQAMLGTPNLLLLDEPFSGLDQPSQDEFVAMLLHLKQQGIAIVLTTHEPLFVERVADITMELQDGRLITLENHFIRKNMKRLEFELTDVSSFQTQMHMLSHIKRQGHKYVALVEQKNSDNIIRALLDAGGSIHYVGDEKAGNAS